MPSPYRDNAALTAAAPDGPRDAAGPGDLTGRRAAAVSVLIDPSLAHVVDLVAYPDGDGIVVANAEGASRIRLSDPDAPAEVLRGRDPIADQNPLAFDSYEAEAADPSPPNARNSYPYAGRRLASLFADAERAPDIVVVHTGRHYWPDRGGHLGEHGSLGVVQSRAPFLLSGAGVTGRGLVRDAARVVDVAPTLCVLAGVDPADLDDMEGSPWVSGITPGTARHVVGLLWDGANSNDLLHLAVTGELPAVARLLDNGFALTGGAVAEFPSVTLVNHTSALTGVGPGRHGVVHNAYFDRRTGEQVVPNDSTMWHRASEWLRPGVRTVFERVAEARPDAMTACVNEPIDRGAAYSTFGLVRAGGASDGAHSMSSALPDPAADPHVTPLHLARQDYHWGSQVDGIGLVQVRQLLEQGMPDLLWWNTTLTDAGHHAGGPRSEVARSALRDADRRLGAFLDDLASRDLLDGTVFLLTADHGSEPADPECVGDWDAALQEAGIPFRDEGYGFVYLGG